MQLRTLLSTNLSTWEGRRVFVGLEAKSVCKTYSCPCFKIDAMLVNISLNIVKPNHKVLWVQKFMEILFA
jgi:hypothetical protein